MRNKVIFGLLTLFVAAAIVSVLMLRRQPAGDPLAFLPADTLALADLHEPADRYAAFRQSRLGQRIVAINWQALLAESGASGVIAADVKSLVDAAWSFLDGPMFSELVGSRAVIALLPPEQFVHAADSQAALVNSLVLITQPRHGTDVLALLSSLFAQAGQTSGESYLGKRLDSFVLADGIVLTVVAERGLLIASFSEERLKACLDLALSTAEEAPRVGDNPGYLALRQRAGDMDQGFFFADMQSLAALASKLPLLPVSTDEVLAAERVIRHGAFFCGGKDNIIHCKGILQRASGAATGMAAPETDEYLADLPADLQLHFWTNLLDLQKLGMALPDNPELEKVATSVDALLVRKSGIGLAEFVSLLGNQISVSVTGVRGNGFFPLPLLCGRMAVKDGPRVQSALDRLFSGYKVTTGDVAGVHVSSLLLTGGLLQPTWGFRDGYGYFADSPDQMKQCLGKAGAQLINDNRFRQVDVGMAGPNNLSSYVNYPLFLDGLRRMLVWGATMLAMTDQQRGRQILALVNHVAVPVLDGLQMYAAGSSRLLVKPEEIEMESALLVADEIKGE